MKQRKWIINKRKRIKKRSQPRVKNKNFDMNFKLPKSNEPRPRSFSIPKTDEIRSSSRAMVRGAGPLAGGREAACHDSPMKPQRGIGGSPETPDTAQRRTNWLVLTGSGDEVIMVFQLMPQWGRTEVPVLSSLESGVFLCFFSRCVPVYTINFCSLACLLSWLLFNLSCCQL